MRFKKAFASVASVALLAIPALALADTPPQQGGSNMGGFSDAVTKFQSAGKTAYGQNSGGDLEYFVGTIIQIFLGLLGVIFLGLMIYGGYLWMMARGNEQQVEKAKETIKAATIGVAIILAGYAITQYVLAAIIGATTGVVK